MDKVGKTVDNSPCLWTVSPWVRKRCENLPKCVPHIWLRYLILSEIWSCFKSAGFEGETFQNSSTVIRRFRISSNPHIWCWLSRNSATFTDSQNYPHHPQSLLRLLYPYITNKGMMYSLSKISKLVICAWENLYAFKAWVWQ